VADLDRNHRPFSVGTGGRFEPEQPADFAGITSLIAQTAIEHDLMLLHKDNDFRLMSRIIPLKFY
jgi:hypothetical protein